MLLKKVGKILLIIIASLLFLVLILFRGVDLTPREETQYYQSTISKLDSVAIHKVPSTYFKSAWSKTNITPDFPADLAGFKPRGKFKSVADSLYMRCLLLDNGNLQSAILSFDLIMVHPVVAKRILDVLKENQINTAVYFAATHTHTGYGNWAPDLVSKFILGDYDQRIVDLLANKTLESIKKAQKDLKESKIATFEIANPDQVRYRIATPGGRVDNLIRGVQLIRSDSSKAILHTYSAHPATVETRSDYISADYPGEVNRLLETSAFDFAIFLAGTVGSHGAALPNEPQSIEAKNGYAQRYTNTILEGIDGYENYFIPRSMSTLRFPIALRDPHLRLTEEIRIRPWVFNSLLGELKADVQLLQIGSIVLCGMPCDFSGELWHEINDYDSITPIITSFNGKYIGYITKDSIYNYHGSETFELNWFGHENGAYFTEVANKLFNKY